MKTFSTCEVCLTENVPVQVACVPGVACSMAYCNGCLTAKVHPMDVLIANTACCDGLKNCNSQWQDMVHTTLSHFNKTEEWFNSEVAKNGRPEFVIDFETKSSIDDPLSHFPFVLDATMIGMIGCGCGYSV